MLIAAVKAPSRICLMMMTQLYVLCTTEKLEYEKYHKIEVPPDLQIRNQSTS